MTVLIWGMVLFFGAHLLSLTPARAPLYARLGEKAYKGIYSVVSLVGLGLMIWGFGLARSGPDAARIVYDPVMGSSHLSGSTRPMRSRLSRSVCSLIARCCSLLTCCSEQPPQRP